jgi:carboxyl-terminal processing protease
MKNLFKKYPFILAIALTCFLSVFAVPFMGLKAENSNEGALLSLVRSHITREFVKKDVDKTQLEYGAIRGMLASLNDPYSRFIEPKAFEQMQDRLKGEFYGIGIQIGMKNNHLTVIAPIPGTPAEKAGLRSLDIIASIDGKATDGLGLEEAVSLIRGPKGSTVVLGIRKPDQKIIKKVSIVREIIRTNAVDKEEIFIKDNKKIGYIRLTTFENQYATREIQVALERLQKKQMQGLILDLRNNGGGLLKNATGIAGLFMSNVSVVHTVDREGKRKTESVYGDPEYTAPLVILVNEGSASASEILSGAVKDNKRGLIVGKHTFGKASVQKIIDLPDGAAVLLTIQRYLTPNGTDITEKGITVDVEVGIPTSAIKAAQKPNYVYSYDKDPQIQKAIQVASELINGKRKLATR